MFDVVFENEMMIAQRHWIQINQSRHFGGQGGVGGGGQRCGSRIVVHVSVNEESQIVFDVRTDASENGGAE